jgi:NAD(P)-dependent dehydrogenase (short-subunit alcohol dehydrogenase family)
MNHQPKAEHCRPLREAELHLEMRTMALEQQFRLDGKRAAITGAASGIGRAIANAFADVGARLFLMDINGGALDEAADALPGDVRTHAVDVTDPDAVNAAAEVCGDADILVNSAGIAVLHGALDVADEDWRRVMDVNLNGTFWPSRAFGAGMVRSGRGSIVNLGSMSGIIVNRPQTAASYMASKGAVHMLTKALATEWADKGVRVNALAPGYVATDMTLKIREARPELFNAWLGCTPMGRCGDVDEIAAAALFLASDASAYVTGAILSIDGGYTCW